MEDEKFQMALRKFFKRQGITQQEIGNTLGTSQSYINSLFSGRNPIGKSTAQKLSDAYGLSVAWLLTGEGPMMAADVSATAGNNVAVTAGNNGVAGNGNTATGNTATDLIALLVEANRQLTEQNIKLTEQNAKLIDYLLSNGKPLP